jgi:hypothetical protein
MPILAEWDSFYVIMGSAAGALIGLQFVVMTLLAGSPTPRSPEAGATYGTPTVIHFSVVLLVAAYLRAPWQSMLPVTALWGLMGPIGLAYALLTARRMQAQTIYKPEGEDWLFHFLLPLVAYGLVTAAALASESAAREALFGVGAAVLLLLFGGIHNAWDSVAYHVFVNMRKEREAAAATQGRPKKKTRS